MAPTYFVENRYSFVVDALRDVTGPPYEVETPETAFERDMQRRLAGANRLLMLGKYSAAISEYRHLRGLIAKTLNPRVSVFEGGRIDWAGVAPAEVARTLLGKSAQMLDRTPVAESALPPSFQGGTALSRAVTAAIAPVEGLGVTDRDASLGAMLRDVETSVGDSDFPAAAKTLEAALAATTDTSLRAALTHDLAIVQERSGNRAAAFTTMQRSVTLFERAGNLASQAVAIEALADMQLRGGDSASSTQTRGGAEELRKTHSIFPIDLGLAGRPSANALAPAAIGALAPTRSNVPVRPDTPGRIPVGDAVLAGPAMTAAAGAGPGAARLISVEAFASRKTAKTLTIAGEAADAHTVQLGAAGATNLETFYRTLQQSRDVGLLMGYLATRTNTVAYLTHVHAWVIPMAMGDCLAALGSYADAEVEYRSTLNYPYLNEVVETVTLWLRLAELYVEWGDRLYRAAGNDPAGFGPAKAQYEKVLRLDNTIDGTSALYAHAKFAAVRTRAAAVIQARFVGRTPIDENPRIGILLGRARLQLTKIAAGLNFLGFGLHIPPFSFEHLQNLARYFAQHAGQVEQMYIQFQSSAENETLREQQMAQQVSLAAASVELERRGVTEAREGVDVASANLTAATVQRDNAVELRNDFAAVRWEMQELERLQAWAGAAGNDEVKLNVVHATYYSADSKKRSHVLFDLASRRAQISHDLEATRLQNEVDAANAYRAVAQQQVEQAQARVAVAEQRVAIAQLQEQHARENLEFLKDREFSSALWYGLAREARLMSGRYLDMAIEVATLMEKAYEAETGRNLRKIKLEYGRAALGGLLGADALLFDIDYFSLDFVRTRAKKAQMKGTLSLADLFPMAFHQLITTGRARFETTLAHFDRRYPGFYLQKIKQVEVLFIGLGGTEGVHGTLRNIGVSRFRREDGSVATQLYPADVMPLSEYDVRQDAIVFQLDPKELRLFENNGIATMWQIDLPRSSNTFDLRQILDVQVVLYYDGFFNDAIERQIRAALPATGAGSRALGLRLYAPDELFFLRSQGSARLSIEPALFPANETNPVLASYVLQAVGRDVAGMRVRVDLAGAGASHTFTLDDEGSANGAAFDVPVNRSLFDTWTFTIDPADNPQLLRDGQLDLSGLTDMSLFLEYRFDYRQ